MKPSSLRVLLLATLISPLSWAQTSAETSDFDERPAPVKAVAPTYPDQLRREGVAGMVMVKVLVNENGDVAERSVSKSTHPGFDEPALAAVSRWKFKPAMKGGQPVKALITVPIKFTVES